MRNSYVSDFLFAVMALKVNDTKRLLNRTCTQMELTDSLGFIAFREIFKFMLCPSIVFNIKAVPANVDTYYLTEINTDIELLTMLSIMLEKDLRGKRLKKLVASISKACSPQMETIFDWVLKKKNPAKVGKTMINQVFPDLIRTQLYMGALPGTEEELERMFNENEFINVQKKEDGMCILIEYKDGKPVSGNTRQGNDIGKYFPDFMASLPNVFVHDVVAPEETNGFNGMVHHELFAGHADRKTGNGLVNKQVINGVVGGPVDTMLHSVLLDLVDYDWLDASQACRYRNLMYFESVQSKRVEQRTVRTLSEAREWALKLIAGGNEGVICKVPSAPFRNGKHRNCLKIKNEFTVELKCIGFKVHKENENWIGSLAMMSEDGLLAVNVTARSQADKEMDFNAWKNNIFSVKAESIIKSKKAKCASLYLARFDGDCYSEYIRTDKLLADTLHSIENQETMSKEIK